MSALEPVSLFVRVIHNILTCYSHLTAYCIIFVVSFSVYNATIINLKRMLKYNIKHTAVTGTHSQSRAILEKLPVVQPHEKFPTFYGTRRFITVFTRALHWSLS
jgi:hypothetical protein